VLGRAVTRRPSMTCRSTEHRCCRLQAAISQPSGSCLPSFLPTLGRPSTFSGRARLSCPPNTCTIVQHRSPVPQTPSRELHSKQSPPSLLFSLFLVGQAPSVAVLPDLACLPCQINAPSSSADHQPCRPQEESCTPNSRFFRFSYRASWSGKHRRWQFFANSPVMPAQYTHHLPAPFTNPADIEQRAPHKQSLLSCLGTKRKGPL
jgi:hypothetical protein